MAERIGEHGKAAVNRVAGFPFLHRSRRKDLRRRGLDVLDNEVGVDG